MLSYRVLFHFAEVNAADEDQTRAPILLSRSMGLLRLGLSGSQVASETRLHNELIKRSRDNSMACGILDNHHHAWAFVGGRPAEALYHPSAIDIEHAKQCCQTLQKMSEGDDPDELSDCERLNYAPLIRTFSTT